MTDVKICGLNDTTHIRVAAEAGADWVGFVVFEKSPRHVIFPGDDGLEHLHDLVRAAEDCGINSTVLLVDPDEEMFGEVLFDIQPNAIQLHGAETQAQLERMWRDCDGMVELWKAFSVGAETDLDMLETWPVDRILLDAKPAETSDLPGGNGVSFEWSLVQGHSFTRPWILAGGLDATNVADAIHATGAPMVDVSSGVESAPGVKDEDLIRAFIDVVKSV